MVDDDRHVAIPQNGINACVCGELLADDTVHLVQPQDGVATSSEPSSGRNFFKDDAGQPTDEPTEADREPTSAEKLLGESLVDSVKAFGDLGMLVMQTIADGGSLDTVLEATADFMDGRDCVDDESIALFNRAKAALVGGRSAAPTRDEAQADAAVKHVYAILGERAPTDIDIEAGTADAPWWLSLRDAFDRALDLLSRSAAEPPEDHGVRWVHPGCEACQQVGRVLVPARRDDCSCWEGGPEDCRVHALAAEPPGEVECAACEVESSGNCPAHRARPVWAQAPSDGGVAAEPNEETGDGE